MFFNFFLVMENKFYYDAVNAVCVYILRDDNAVGVGSEVIYICGASGTKAASTQVQYMQHIIIILYLCFRSYLRIVVYRILYFGLFFIYII